MTFLVFLKKEIRESLKTSVVLIVGAVMVFFALMGPLTARYMIEIMSMVADLGEIVLPEPTYMDSFVQFFKNNNSIGMLVLIFAFMGTLAREKDKKTVYLMLTKSLSRRHMYLSKLCAALIIYTGLYLLSVLVFYGYTMLLFDTSQVVHLGLAFSLYWLYGVFVLAMTVFFSTVTNNISSVAALSIITYLGLSLLANLSAIKAFVPATLSNHAMNLLMGTQNAYLLTVVSTIGLSCLLTIGGISLFEEQEL